MQRSRPGCSAILKGGLCTQRGVDELAQLRSEEQAGKGGAKGGRCAGEGQAIGCGGEGSRETDYLKGVPARSGWSWRSWQSCSDDLWVGWHVAVAWRERHAWDGSDARYASRWALWTPDAMGPWPLRHCTPPFGSSRQRGESSPYALLRHRWPEMGFLLEPPVGSEKRGG